MSSELPVERIKRVWDDVPEPGPAPPRPGDDAPTKGSAEHLKWFDLF